MTLGILSTSVLRLRIEVLYILAIHHEIARYPWSGKAERERGFRD
jgi:hypothetical protein